MGKLAQTRHVFVAEGYAPAPDAAALQNELREKFFAAVELVRPDPKGEQPPVELRNGGFSAPMEGVLASYSFPGRGEFDPSFMMALFYYCLFRKYIQLQMDLFHIKQVFYLHLASLLFQNSLNLTIKFFHHYLCI